MMNYEKNIQNIIGFISSIIVFIIIPLLPYQLLTKIKAFLIFITSFIIFATKLEIIQKIYFNTFIKLLIMANIIGLIMTNNPLLINILIIIITITTPNFKIDNNNNIQMDSILIDKKIWIILMTITLVYIYLYNKPFFNCLKCTQHKIVNSLVLFALIIPTIIFFINATWIENRLFSLNFVIIFDYILSIF
jgi:hypothetical protein